MQKRNGDFSSLSTSASFSFLSKQTDNTHVSITWSFNKCSNIACVTFTRSSDQIYHAADPRKIVYFAYVTVSVTVDVANINLR